MKMALVGMVAAASFFADTACAVEQVWDDAGPDNIWSTNAPNWSGGAVWTNGSSAVFSGVGGTQSGETVDVSNAVTVANMSFQTNGYVIADADANGTLTLAGGGEIRVVNAGDSAVVSEAVGGAGFTKSGNGLLQLAGANAFTGEVRVAAGTLRLSKWNPTVLGATGADNRTIVENGATLDIYGAFTNNLNRAEELELAGTGVNGVGALINTGTSCMNSGFSGTNTLRGDTTIGCYSRIDFRNTVVGNNYTLTKIGGQELAVGVEVLNCKIVINSGYYTYMNAKALGTGDFDTTINGGALRSYGNHTVTEHLICNGGSFISAGWGNNTFNIAGRVTLNSNVVVTASADGGGTGTLDLSGLLEGTGGIRRQGSHYVCVTCNTNTYSGPTIIDSGCTLWVGKTNQYSGLLGVGTVTNNGTLRACSSRISAGNIVNSGSIYCHTGVLCGAAGSVVNNGTLYIDRGGAFVLSNDVFGTGTTLIRYGGSLSLDGSFFTNGICRLGSGGLTLTNGAVFKVKNFSFSDRSSSLSYPVDPTNVTARLSLSDTALLDVYNFETGNGNSVTGGGMTGIVEQVGGTLRTYGWSGDPANFPGEYDGLRIGHYGQAYGVYNLRGGTVIIDNGYRLAVATDGTGHFHQTGGEVFASHVIVNARDNSGGYGRLTLEGGVLNVGSNGITTGVGAPYLVEYGGAGGIVRASTNFASSLNATLYGTNENAITFDTTNWAVTLSGKLSGAGGLNKAGAGTLTLSGSNTYSGATRILEGSVTRTSAGALPPGGEVLFGVASDDSGGKLYAAGDLSLEGLVAGVANPEALDESKCYTIASYGGTLTAGFDGDVLPDPWYVCYDRPNKRVQLRAAIGTVFWLK